jgi:hypothetical protein
MMVGKTGNRSFVPRLLAGDGFAAGLEARLYGRQGCPPLPGNEKLLLPPA